jgi:TPR repeat protein
MTDSTPADVAAPLPTPDAAPQSARPAFFPVAPRKLLVMMFATLGAYQWYWMYQNWRLIKERERSKINPALRSLFAMFFIYQLLARIRKAADANGVATRLPVAVLALTWFLCSLGWQFPKPYNLLGYFSFLTLLPAQIAVNRLNQRLAPACDRNARLSRVNIAALVVLLPLQLLGVIGILVGRHHVGSRHAAFTTHSGPVPTYESQRQAALDGDPEAALWLGTHYREGDGLPQNDRLAIRWYRRAANEGYAGGQLELGLMYIDGHGVAADPAAGAGWVRKAADQGLPVAEVDLGQLYEDGIGVPGDPQQAGAWYRKAAQQGDADAQLALGLLYERGTGVPRDGGQAQAWLLKAAGQGSKEARSHLRTDFVKARDGVLAPVLLPVSDRKMPSQQKPH